MREDNQQSEQLGTGSVSRRMMNGLVAATPLLLAGTASALAQDQAQIPKAKHPKSEHDSGRSFGENGAIIERFLILERMAQYQDFVNHQDWERWGDLWTEDAVLAVTAPLNTKLKGRAAIVKAAQEFYPPHSGFLHQMAHGMVVELENEQTARARHTLHIFSSKVTMLGVYYDKLEKGADLLWRFKKRQYGVSYYDTSALTGSIFPRMPDPNYRSLPEDET